MSEKMTGAKMTGGCACGRIRFEAEIDSDEAYLCHCRMCQRASGNVSLAMKESVHEAWIDTSGLPRTRTDEYQRLVDRWVKAGAVPPA